VHFSPIGITAPVGAALAEGVLLRLCAEAQDAAAARARMRYCMLVDADGESSRGDKEDDVRRVRRCLVDRSDAVDEG
jgi:hypothetical protein